MTKLTKQGVRDLGGVVPTRQKMIYQCPHIWELEWSWCNVHDSWDEPKTYQRCGLCKDVRR